MFFLRLCIFFRVSSRKPSDNRHQFKIKITNLVSKSFVPDLFVFHEIDSAFHEDSEISLVQGTDLELLSHVIK